MRIYSQTSAGSWITHATGIVTVKNSEQELSSVDIDALKSRFKNSINKEAFYSHGSKSGINYGPLFQTLDQIYVGEQEAFGEAHLLCMQ